mgnify:CR=1 FL=1
MDTLEQKIKLQKLINDLIELGEDQEELMLWQNFFEAMNETEREKLFLNLTREKEKLENLGKKSA